MKKQTVKKLVLNRETLMKLEDPTTFQQAWAGQYKQISVDICTVPADGCS